MAAEIQIPVAIVAGILSFFSPCVLPLIPGYLAHISGSSLKDLHQSKAVLQRKIFFNSIFFVTGFSSIFIVLGMLLAGVFGEIPPSQSILINRIGGIIIIVFGLYNLGLLHIPYLERTVKVESKTKNSGYLNSVVLGASFGAGWTPCFGPILASILVVAGASGSIYLGGVLLGAYSVGLAIPFIITGAFTSQVSTIISKHRSKFALFTQLSGILLIALGIIVFTNSFVRVLAFLNLPPL